MTYNKWMHPELTSEQMAWLLKHYPTCKPQEAVNALGIPWGEIMYQVPQLRRKGVIIPYRRKPRDTKEHQ